MAKQQIPKAATRMIGAGARPGQRKNERRSGPRPGCATENGEAVALALVELTKMVAGEGFSFSGDIDSGLGAAYYGARGAFERTGSFEDALEDWQDNTVEAALKNRSGDER